jgi:hypothetical protein
MSKHWNEVNPKKLLIIIISKVNACEGLSSPISVDEVEMGYKVKRSVKMKSLIGKSHMLIRALSVAITLLFMFPLAVVSAAGPEPAGWYAGDMHVHRSCGGAPQDIPTMYQLMVSHDWPLYPCLPIWEWRGAGPRHRPAPCKWLE